MKKAFLVTANVTTRVIVDVPENGKLDNNGYDMAVNMAKENLLRNLCNDYLDCIEYVREDFEMPYEDIVDENTKMFSVNGMDIICRGDYESMSCPMYATEFTDEQMQDLAETIYLALSNYGFENKHITMYFSNPCDFAWNNVDIYDEIDTAFWVEMENIAIAMGMRYYEDMTDEEYEEISKK